MSSPIILHVEDNPITARQLQGTLRSNGFAVLDAATVKVALELARRFAPDVVVMEVLLPDLDGFEALRRLRRVRGCESLPAIACTGLLSAADAPAALSAGFAALLPKPVLPSALLREVRRAAAGAAAARIPAKRRIDIVSRGEAWGGALERRLLDLEYATSVYGSAETRLRSRNLVPDLLVSEGTEDGSALRLCRLLRARTRWQDVPIVLTHDGPVSAQVRTALLRAGASAVVQADGDALAIVQAVVDKLELAARKPRPERQASPPMYAREPPVDAPRLPGAPQSVNAREIAAAACVCLTGRSDIDNAELLSPATLTALLHQCTHLTGLPLAALYMRADGSADLELRAWSGALAGVDGERLRRALDGSEALRRCAEEQVPVLLGSTGTEGDPEALPSVDSIGPGLLMPIDTTARGTGVLFLATGAKDLARGPGRRVAELAAAILAPILGFGELLDPPGPAAAGTRARRVAIARGGLA